jgi:lysyl-tRNA synthetase class 2
MTLKKIREVRIKKLKSIERAGLLAYPEKTKRTHTIAQAISKFGQLEKEKKIVFLAGRILALREHGGSTFIAFEDGTGKFQAYFKKDKLGEKGYQFFLDHFDIGDFIEIEGILFKTKKGEKTIEAQDYKMLAKSLLPLPEKWHGLKDIEERYRKRYLDLIFNPQVKEKFIKRAKVIKAIREFLEKESFLEIETPILQTIYGGAKAEPFKTYLKALKLNLYLRIAPELFHKRVLIGGIEKVYEIGRVFRNEGIDRQHNPDFTSLEFYWAFATYKDLMGFTEKMFEYILKNVFGKLEIIYEGKKINFKSPWKRVDFCQLIQAETGIDYDLLNREGLKKKAEELGIEVERGDPKPVIGDKIFKKICLGKIWQPTFVLHHPLGTFPLAKALEKNPKRLANFQLIVAGWELINAFSELNDPIEQKKRFEEQEKIFKEGFKEAQRMDKDFILALEYGMPPAAGFGMGIDRLTAILTNSHSLREVILFPMMKPKEK